MKRTLKKVVTFFILLLVLFTTTLSSPASSKATDLQLLFDNGFCAFISSLSIPVVSWATQNREWYNPSICQFYNRVFDPAVPESEIYGERYTYAQVVWILNSIASYIINFFAENLELLLSYTPAGQSNLASTPTSPTAASALVSSVSFMSTSQPSFFNYSLPQLLEKFDLATPVEAQGFGYQTLSGLQILWGASRDMAYFLMVVFLLIAGFMIIFRVKINPQTAVSLQLMIPRLIITLIAITFSFAVAGLIIDIIYLILGFIIFLLPSVVFSNPNTRDTTLAFFTRSDFGMIWIYYTAMSIPAALSLGGVFMGIIGVIVTPIIVVILLFRVWWMLTKSYLTLIIQTILAPWQILLGLLPGQNGFSTWLRNYVATASVFLVVPLMFLLTVLFWAPAGSSFYNLLNGIVSNLSANLGFPISPNLSGVDVGQLPNLPLYGTGGTHFGGEFLRIALGFGLLAMMPKTAEMIRDALKVPAFKYGTALGEALGPVTVAGRAGAGYGMGYAGTQLGGIPSDQVRWYHRALDAGLSAVSGQAKIPYKSPYTSQTTSSKP